MQRRVLTPWWIVLWRTVVHYAQLLFVHMFTVLNAVIFGLSLWLWLLGYQRDALFTSLVVIINVVVATAQSIRAEIVLRRIQIVSQPVAMVWREGQLSAQPPLHVVPDDVVLLRNGDQVIAHAQLLDANALKLDVSVITGESEPVAHDTGDEIPAGAVCVAGAAWYRVIDIRTTATHYGASVHRPTRMLTPLVRQVNRTIQIIVAVTLALMCIVLVRGWWYQTPSATLVPDLAVIGGLIPNALLLTLTVSYAVAAMHMAQRGGLVQELAAVEAMRHIDVLCLDKTGTITTNRLTLHELRPLSVDAAHVRDRLAGYVAADGAGNRTTQALAQALPALPRPALWSVEFDAVRKWSMRGEVDATYVLGAPDLLRPALHPDWQSLDMASDAVARGARVLLFAVAPAMPMPDPVHLPLQLTPLGIVVLFDTIRADASHSLDAMWRAGMRICLISGDDPQAVQNLAARVDARLHGECVHGERIATATPTELHALVRTANVFGRVTPQQKAHIVAAMQTQGLRVAMVGDGINDIPALQMADVAVAMQSGSSAVRNSADVVLLGDRLEILPHLLDHGNQVYVRMQAVLHHFLLRVVMSAWCLCIGIVLNRTLWSPIDSSLLALCGVAVPALLLVVLPIPASWIRAGLAHRQRLWWRIGVSTALLGVLAGGVLWYGGDLGAWVWWGCMVLLWVNLLGELWYGRRVASLPVTT
jgi:cation-transporting ATPase E